MRILPLNKTLPKLDLFGLVAGTIWVGCWNHLGWLLEPFGLVAGTIWVWLLEPFGLVAGTIWVGCWNHLGWLFFSMYIPTNQICFSRSLPLNKIHNAATAKLFLVAAQIKT
jgi:hypothetical protein